MIGSPLVKVVKAAVTGDKISFTIEREGKRHKKNVSQALASEMFFHVRTRFQSDILDITAFK